MVEDEIDEKQSDYLPFVALIKGPDYRKLFKAPEGRDLFKTLQDKFGNYKRLPYETPREDDKDEYILSIIK